MTPQELLLKAADVLSEGGHCKNIAANMKGEHCAMGALWEAADETWVASVRGAAALLAKRIPDDYFAGVGRCADPAYDVVDWNNAPETTGEDVILAMKRAAHG